MLAKLIQSLPPEAIMSALGLEGVPPDLKKLAPYVEKFMRARELALKTAVGSISGPALSELLGIFDVDLSTDKVGEIAAAIRAVAEDENASLADFILGGGIKQVVELSNFTRAGGVKLESTIRCPHCDGLIVANRTAVQPEIEGLIRCPHCGNLVI